jgi:hypothetical protein
MIGVVLKRYPIHSLKIDIGEPGLQDCENARQ